MTGVKGSFFDKRSGGSRNEIVGVVHMIFPITFRLDAVTLFPIHFVYMLCYGINQLTCLLDLAKTGSSNVSGIGLVVTFSINKKEKYNK